MNIDKYVEKVYKNFDGSNEEVQILKEEMKAHLYDSVKDLRSQGYSEKESFSIAIKNFGDEDTFYSELQDIMAKQKTFTNMLIKTAVVVFVIGAVVWIGGLIAQKNFINEYEKNRLVNGSDILNKIQCYIENKVVLTEDDKSKINKWLDGYNEENYNGLYYLDITNGGKSFYHYEKKVSEELIRNSGECVSGNNKNGWSVHSKQTDIDSLIAEHNDGLRRSLEDYTESWHYKLKNTGFWLITLSWLLAVMHYTQKFILEKGSITKLLVILCLETLIMFATFTFYKEIIILSLLAFIILNQFMFKESMHKKVAVF
ncbi:permease prefix domain 1-containing protein [Clostridium sp. C8-1-8]|uniref:permease prefix domain 1-containing protein n=1 Tax=Clostridium sp. C8-1-8 TaxID=2698831 RepID=UPI00136BBAF9|nr:permease prefix domain 1-containing protein [Clostridium sp. C8-1-8]